MTARVPDHRVPHRERLARRGADQGSDENHRELKLEVASHSFIVQPSPFLSARSRCLWCAHSKGCCQVHQSSAKSDCYLRTPTSGTPSGYSQLLWPAKATARQIYGQVVGHSELFQPAPPMWAASYDLARIRMRYANPWLHRRGNLPP